MLCKWSVSLSILLIMLLIGCTKPKAAQMSCTPVAITPQLDNNTFANLTRIGPRLTGPATKILLHEGYLYLQADSNLVILDVSDPVKPVEVAALPNAYIPQTVVDNIAYLYWNEQMQTLDVSDPENLVGSTCANYVRPNLISATFADGYAYDGGTSLTIYDISNLRMPIELSSYQADSLPDISMGFPDGEWLPQINYQAPAPLKTISVAVTETYALLGTGQFALDSWAFGHLTVLDVSNPYEPKLVTTLDMPESAVPLSLVIEGDYAFVSSAGQWITNATFIFDISNPRRPVQVARIPNGIFYEVHNGMAYFYNSDLGLDIWDVKNPEEPTFLDTIELPLTYFPDSEVYINYLYDFEIDGDFAFVALNELGLHILDISDPNTVMTVATIKYDIWPTSQSIEVIGDIILLTTIYGEVFAVNSLTEAPLSKTDLFSGIDVFDVALANSLAFVSQPKDGISVFDVSDLHTPRFVSTFFQEGFEPYSLHENSGVLYALEPESGLHAFLIDEDSQLIPTGTLAIEGLSYLGDIFVWADYAYVTTGSDPILRVFDISVPETPILVEEIIHSQDLCAITGSELFLYATSCEDSVFIFSLDEPSVPNLIDTKIVGANIRDIQAANGRLYFALRRGLAAIELETP